MLSTETIIPQLILSGVAHGTTQDNAVADFAKIRQYIPTNGYITLIARTVPIYPLSVRLIRLH